ncbi:MAG TPA: hypothetical protein VMU69_19175 [Bradyrhizobium sp.]|nr:hypothetical protein [Bradyrhizobium sp.]
MGTGDLYPDAIENLLDVKSDCREFFEQLINPPGIPPSRGYVPLTQILRQGWISTVLTTNFDQCLERAAIARRDEVQAIRLLLCAQANALGADSIR